MKILIISQKFPPTIGGGETIAYNQARFLAKLGHNVTVLTEEGGILNQKTGFKIIRSKDINQIASGVIDLSNGIKNLDKLINNGKFDIIHVHNYLVYIATLLITQLSKSKLIFTQHCTPVINKKVIGFLGDYEYEYKLANFCFKNRSTDKLVAISQVYKKWAEHNGVQTKQIFLNYPGVDLEIFNHNNYDGLEKRLRKKLGFCEKDFIVLCPIRFLYRKGIFDIVDAFKEIQNKRIKLLIIGSESKTDKNILLAVKNKISEFSLKERVKILREGVSYFNMPRHYSMANLVCLPSHFEGLGISLLESMAMKKMTLASKIPGITEIVNKHNGYLITPHKPKELAKKIITLSKLRNKENEKIIKNGYKMIKKKFNCEIQTKKLSDMYEKIQNLPK